MCNLVVQAAGSHEQIPRDRQLQLLEFLHLQAARARLYAELNDCQRRCRQLQDATELQNLMQGRLM